MEKKQQVKAVDTLRSHFTTIDQVYEIMDEDEDCYKIVDNRGKYNWIPKRYMTYVD